MNDTDDGGAMSTGKTTAPAETTEQATGESHSEVVEQYEETAVNCLTGGYAALTGVLGRPVAEQTVFERGDGYLFQAGLDEAGYPEYIFPVEAAGALGMARSGFTVHAEPIDADRAGPQLEELLRRFKAVVVWVNTAHLRYADIYTSNPAYLHAVLIEGISDDHRHVEILDTLVVGPKPFSCRARLTAQDFLGAVTDRIRTESHDGMGFFYAVTDDLAGADGSDGSVPAAEDAAGAELRGALARQAERYFAEERFHTAIRRYEELCAQCFADTPERSAVGARRLFHHSSVLYAVPSLTLMGRSLADAGAGEECFALHDDLLRHWRAMGVLALRYEATRAPSVLDRVHQRFDQIDRATAQLWKSLA
ncbi:MULTISPECIES: hypothetical protein [unclassified Streptomyces]|uniref:hypothetical protein n=1 Tax=unclassified Streptomyces TaxID=2593676 RepID=UPI000CD5024D|nr:MULTISPECIES: hypothetical protein [unclassified Streptomyces]